MRDLSLGRWASRLAATVGAVTMAVGVAAAPASAVSLTPAGDQPVLTSSYANLDKVQPADDRVESLLEFEWF